MMRSLAFALLLPLFGFSQTLTGEQLLNKTIEYHDPTGQWESFSGNLSVEMTGPDRSPRYTDLTIDLPNSFFKAVASQDDTTITFSVDNGQCNVSIEPATKKAPDCERALMYRDYYTYLYGMPMKLKDPGTIIDPVVEQVAFKGKNYLRLKVSYDAAVGSDVWHFYFDPTTYAMEVYQFFKGDPEGAGKGTGEYIVLSGTHTVNGIKMPKDRAWYYNKDDKFLGQDALTTTAAKQD